MGRFILLHNTNGTPVHIRENAIVYIRKTELCTVLYLIGDSEAVLVKESPEEIFAMMER